MSYTTFHNCCQHVFHTFYSVLFISLNIFNSPLYLRGALVSLGRFDCVSCGYASRQIRNKAPYCFSAFSITIAYRIVFSSHLGSNVPLKTVTSDPSARNAEAVGAVKNSTN